MPLLAASLRAACHELQAFLRAVLGRRPDRTIVGTVRRVETFDVLQALNGERPGSTTIHALPLRRCSHDSRTTVSTPGRVGCHMEVSERGRVCQVVEKCERVISRRHGD